MLYGTTNVCSKKCTSTDSPARFFVRFVESIFNILLVSSNRAEYLSSRY